MFVLSNPLYVSRLVGLCCLVVAVHEFHGEVLNIMDLFFRRVLSPTVHFLYSVSFFGRVLYEPAVVVFDIYVAVSKTAMYGSLALVTKCNIDLLTCRCSKPCSRSSCCSPERSLRGLAAAAERF